MSWEKRGGYGGGSKPVAQIKPPTPKPQAPQGAQGSQRPAG